MSDAFVGEIRLTVLEYAPQDWVICDGRLLTISGNEALFSLISTTYGGDGKTNFGVPDLRGRLPLGVNSDSAATSHYALGTKAGLEAVTVTEATYPAHTHAFNALNTPATSLSPSSDGVTDTKNMALADVGSANYLYAFSAVAGSTVQNLDAATIGQAVGGGQAHSNIMEVMGLTYMICTAGLYPTNN